MDLSNVHENRPNAVMTRYIDNYDSDFSTTARKLGVGSGIAVLTLQFAYAVALAVGLASLPSSDQPIGDPVFFILEILILLMLPAMIGLMVAVHAWPTARHCRLV